MNLGNCRENGSYPLRSGEARQLLNERVRVRVRGCMRGCARARPHVRTGAHVGACLRYAICVGNWIFTNRL